MEQKLPTVSIKLSLSGSKKRVRLNVPLKFSQLQYQVRKSFPTIKEFNLDYVDEEGDNITVTSDADLEEAQSVFKNIGRVISFIVDTSSTPDRNEHNAAGTTGTTSKSPVRIKVKSTKSPTENPSKSSDAKCDFNYDFNHLREMGKMFFEHPERIGDVIKSCMRPANGRTNCTGAATCPREGDVVELHSLSTAGFNGRRGRCDGFDRETGRHRVVLFATKVEQAQTIAVRTRNLKVVTPDSPCENVLPTSTPIGPGSFGPDVVKLQKVLIKLGYMHPSATRHFQGFYGPRTTASVSKIAKAIGCAGGGVFTDRVRAHLLQRLASTSPCQTRCASKVSVPTIMLRKLSTLVPNSKTAPVSVKAATTAAAPVSVPTTTEAVPTTTTKATESVPTKKAKETVPVLTKPVPVPMNVQQLLEMGFTLPVETLTNVLAAANDDVGAALNALLGC